MKIYLIIAASTIKMYFRRTQSLFWTLFFPVVMMVGLGFFGFGEYEKPKLGLIDEAENSISAEFVNKLEQKSYIEIDKNYIRPLDVNTLLGDSRKARKKLNWKPKINIENLINEMIADEINLIENLR